MSTQQNLPPSRLMVILAFGVVYIVWGSTYFFIRVAIEDFPPFIMAAIRFIISGGLMFAWCMYKKEKMFNWHDIRPAVISGLLMLFIGNGAVVWSEQYLASSLAAILVSAGPIWFVMLDRKNWGVNFRSRNIIIGLLVGFAGVIVLFSDNIKLALSGSGSMVEIFATALLVIGSISWAAGSLYSKYKTAGQSNTVNTTWQMLSAGLMFSIISLTSGETKFFEIAAVSLNGWMALLYLVVMGSLVGYSAYVWLLSVRPATQVSTHSYVNPIVAVLLGVLLVGESLTTLQVTGLFIILFSVLLVNLNKYLKPKQALQKEPAAPVNREISEAV